MANGRSSGECDRRGRGHSDRFSSSNCDRFGNGFACGRQVDHGNRTRRDDLRDRCRNWRSVGGGLARLGVDLVEREADRLARIARDRLDADERRDLVRRTRRLGQRHPLGHPRIDLVGGNVLRRDQPRLLPIARKGVGEREILARARIGTGGARGGVEHLQRRLRIPRQRQREAEIGRIDDRLRFGEQPDRFARLTQRGHHQRQLEDQLRLVRDQAHRIAISGLGRGETTGGEVAIAEQCAEAGIVRAAFDRALGERGGGGDVVGGERKLRPGRQPDVGGVDLVSEDRGAARPAGAGSGAGGGQRDQRGRGQLGSQAVRIGHDMFPIT